MVNLTLALTALAVADVAAVLQPPLRCNASVITCSLCTRSAGSGSPMDSAAAARAASIVVLRADRMRTARWRTVCTGEHFVSKCSSSNNGLRACYRPRLWRLNERVLLLEEGNCPRLKKGEVDVSETRMRAK